MEKRNKLLISLLLIIMSMLLPFLFFRRNNIFLNTKEFIYKPLHIVFEFFIIAASLFFIIEAIIHIKNSKKNKNLNRILRIVGAVGVLVVHISVLFMGGYS